MATIRSAVGRGAKNDNADDVKLVQKLLNEKLPSGSPRLREDGKVGDKTIAAIEDFQARVVRMRRPDGRVDPNGTTLQLLSQPALNSTGESSALASQKEVHSMAVGGTIPEAGPAAPPQVGDIQTFSHPNASKVVLTYGKNAVRLNAKAEHLLKSILASVDITGATVTSTLRTYHDQARITLTQTYKADPANVTKWYGQKVRDACDEYAKTGDIEGFAKWWKKYDQDRGKVSSKHLTNRALDVVPTGDRAKFAKKVQELVPVAGSSVQRIIPKGVMGEPVDHVEFTFPVTDQSN